MLRPLIKILLLSTFFCVYINTPPACRDVLEGMLNTNPWKESSSLIEEELFYNNPERMGRELLYNQYIITQPKVMDYPRNITIIQPASH